MSQPILRHHQRRPQRGRTAAGATILALLLAVLPACDALSTDPLLTAEENRNKPGGTTVSLKPVTVSPREVSLEGIGRAHQLAVTVLNPAGKARQNPAVTWRSLNPGVAKVDSKGKVTAAAVGLALITATYGAHADTARVTVQQAAPPPAPGAPVVATVAVTPASSTLEIGRTLQLTAEARDGEGNVLQRTFSWTSANPALVSVSQSGSITAHAAGVVGIQAESEGKAAVAVITVPAPLSQPSQPAPSLAEVRCTSHPEWDCVVQDQSLVGDVVVPDGQKWLIGRNVEVRGSVRTHNGTIALRSGSSLKFVGLDINKVVGGGMHWTPEVANDFGIWVGQGHHATGRLDIDCGQFGARQGWSRTGTGEGWQAGDEYWISPTAAGDYAPRRWSPGQPIPQAAPGLPSAEVANVTRSCTIEGPGHILVHSRASHRVIGVRLERMGLITPSRGATSGRYALHFHHAGDLPYSIVYRVAAVNSGGRVFVPHNSHNMNWMDLVSVNSQATGFWWDPGEPHASHNIAVQNLLVMGVRLPAGVANVASAADAIVLERGMNVAIRHSAASGADGDGFVWPEGGESSWYFSDNSGHNNRGFGISFHHLMAGQSAKERNHAYRNAKGGYDNFGGPNVWDDLTLIEDHLVQRSSATVWGNGRLGEFRRPRIQSSTGSAIVVTGLVHPPQGRTLYTDCVLQSASGHPKVLVQGGQNPWRAHFRRCGMTPEDVVFRAPIATGLEGTSILIDHEDGRKWEIVVQGGQRIVRTL